MARTEYWNSLPEDERIKNAKADFENLKDFCAVGLTLANLVSLITVSLAIFAGEWMLQGLGDHARQEMARGIFLTRTIFAALILLSGFKPWSSLYHNGVMRRARHYKVLHTKLEDRFFDIAFGTVAFGSLLFAVPVLRQPFLFVPYFVLTGVSLCALSPRIFLFLFKPPREAA